jgi:hypothetical protein
MSLNAIKLNSSEATFLAFRHSSKVINNLLWSSAKMKSQLDLLRNEHLQLQSQHANLQKRYDILQAENQMQNGREFGSSFAEKLLETVHNLYGSELYRLVGYSLTI